MTGIILVTHDALGEAVRREAENILDRPVALTTVAVSYRADVEETLAALRIAVATGADAQGAVVLTDLPGATPHNLANQAAEEHGIPVVSGLNLPMLLKTINHADKPPAELAALAADGGSQGIVRA
ncbi:PTS sugar transporter subunit IIA [Wenzhouxiangella sediminis]|uniref:PTS sugar transporter subunit IIA n=1 Tax=Wenzhouxiangella sediminis TaxID=1792836 RepID=UPI0015F29783|nr:PTS sugar transporter subunit IIA [Wenzhouxiangella sediminis]